MTIHNRRSLTLALVVLGLPSLQAQEIKGRPEFGASLVFQRPVGEFESQVLDSTVGLGLDARLRFTLAPKHGLTARLGYQWFAEGGTTSRTADYALSTNIKVQEYSLGLDYEWRYGGSSGGYLIAGPVFRRWNDSRSYDYAPYTFKPIPANHTDRMTPSHLGLSVGWGYQTSNRDAAEIRVTDSKYGDTGFRATALQFSFTVYW